MFVEPLDLADSNFVLLRKEQQSEKLECLRFARKFEFEDTMSFNKGHRAELEEFDSWR